MATAEEGLLAPGSFLRPWGRWGRLRTRRTDDAVDVASEIDLLTRLAKAEWVSGVGDARAHLRQAAIMARKAGLARALAEVLSVNVRPSFDSAQDADTDKIELLESALGSLDGAPALRARILGALAVELIFTGDAASRGLLLDEARGARPHVGRSDGPRRCGGVRLPGSTALELVRQ